MTDHAAEGGTGQATHGIGGLSVPIGVHVAVLRQADNERQRDLREADRTHGRELREADRALQKERLEAQKERTLLAESNAEQWRASANEWRGTVSDLISRVPTRDELGALAARVDELKQAHDRDTGSDRQVDRRRSSLQPYVAAILSGVVAIIVAVILANVLTT